MAHLPQQYVEVLYEISVVEYICFWGSNQCGTSESQQGVWLWDTLYARDV